ncbi:X-Pro dipeptidyl-peptidase, S15 family [Leptospira yanagawae serovar Saopaulo str. Sao Paulo = ATCC 700523]|uniref:X-Pro dipeptidyl-peptidase, S15 family n=1 Tax=Leptospira yanagawae serovar Saopaulo str. Sao Paulo = ATCC 700523 TaxID=1249483 RepID=A0A5E8H7T2_9LEPT|nr:CocE/NonD family hydrolase [Leptospira yanagawae]EOQ87234.1 X-Pro dipeptidyl-peptidase, S15 family [Leptospira yanagawae serovar Saopaulo str. Sao Paulo = ATCC 700523]
MKKQKNYLTLLLIVGNFLLIACGGNGNQNGKETSAILSVLNGQAQSSNVTPEMLQLNNAATTRDIQTAFQNENDGSFTFNDNISFLSNDGVKITGNLFIPKSGTGPYPAVIFVNSWALNEYEYIVPAAKLAKKGYVVFSYNTRGFGTSGGLINVAGPKDMEDLSKGIDFLLANAPVNPSNIGIAGISYGAGISLLGLSKEPRIKTAVAMSGWGSLPDSLYGNQSPRLVWGLLLVTAGYITGRMDPIIAENFQKLLDTRDVATVLSWARERSPNNFVAELNTSGKPVYISNNSQDNLFQPNQILPYFEQLTVPKKLDLNNGIHATAEIGGVLGLNNYVWTNAYDWFDYWLKGIQNGIMTKPKVTIQKRFSSDRVSYANWPIPSKVERTYHLRPMGLLSPGKITTTANTSNGNDTILSGGTSATTGVPLLSEILDGAVSVPVTTNVNLIDRTNAMLYLSDRLSSPLKLRGRTFYKGRINSSDYAPHVVVYLYEVDFWGTGKLISHGTATLFNVKGKDVDLNVDLQAVAHDFPAGSRIGLAIDNIDPMYAVPKPVSLYTTTFKHSTTTASTLKFESE